MTPIELLQNAIDPAHAMLAKFGVFSDDRSRVLSLAIAGQESDWIYRVQNGGPARSFWQFELGGGVVGVLTHPSTTGKIKLACAELHVPCIAQHVYMTMADNDILAACMARLLLYADPRQLPAIGQEDAAWHYYLDGWRPGMPHPTKWPQVYQLATQIVKSNPL